MANAYYLVTLATGKNVIACDAPESFVRNCLENTGAVFKETTQEVAKSINCYNRVNGGEGWDRLRIKALEAYVDVLTQVKLAKD